MILELVATTKDELRIYSFNGFSLDYETIATAMIDRASLSVADYDNDADLDILLTSFGMDFLLVNNLTGGWLVVPPSKVGINNIGFGASFVDFDNDGWVDIASLSGGLFQQQLDGTFLPVQGLPIFDGVPIRAGLGVWFDYDNDGDRDLVRSLLPVETEIPRLWKSEFFENQGADGHNWTQIDLLGPENNRSAIGATVKVTAGAKTQIQQVGVSSEDSRYSQGHYRLYFGFGSDLPTEIAIRWPDGLETVVPHNDALNKLIRVHYPEIE